MLRSFFLKDKNVWIILLVVLCDWYFTATWNQFVDNMLAKNFFRDFKVQAKNFFNIWFLVIQKALQAPDKPIIND